ncbi:hypothetical protein OCB15_18005 [Bacillus cereus]|nr:hypothetical protein [Bacillus cereus]
MADHLKAKCSYDGMGYARITFGIDQDNDLEIELYENEHEKGYVYINLKDMKEFRKGIKGVLSRDIEEYTTTCSEDPDDIIEFELSNIHEGYVNISMEGSAYLFARFPIAAVKEIVKDLKDLRKIMKKGAE